MNSDSDNFEFSEEEIDDKSHDRLIENVLKLNKIQHVKSPHRTESTTKVSEFNLVKSLHVNQNLVHVNELTKVLKGRKSHLEISNKVKSTNSRSKTLLKPLDKPQADRIKRALNYERSRLQLDKWEALVTSNRAAAQLTFPLDSTEKVKILEKRAEIYPSTFRIKSDLQKKLEALEPKVEEYHVDVEDKDEYPLTLEELKEKRKEAAKLRAHQSFKEAKARRQNKIKSKKYHRILRREKIKQKLKEFEELQKVNPEEALKKLEDIEKARAEERFSLRHKGTGQWARNKQVRAKYDKESRQELAKQLAISRELTQKLKSVDSDSEDEGIQSGDISSPTSKTDEKNPWVHDVIKPTKDVADFVSGYRKYWNEKNSENDDNPLTKSLNNKIISSKNDKRAKESVYENVADDKTEKDGKNETNQNINEKTKDKIDKNKKKLKFKDTKVNSRVADLKEKKKLKNLKSAKRKENIQSDTSLSTSEWEVSGLENETGESLDVEEVFDTLEDKLSQKMNQKLNKIKNKSQVDKSKKIKPKIKKKQKIDLSLPLKKKKQVIDEEMLEEAENLNDDDDEDAEKDISADPDLAALKNIIGSVQKTEELVNINPAKFIKVKPTNLNTAIPDILTTTENEETVDQRDIIMEAFEDDDIAVDFDKEKAAEVEKDTPKDIDLNLPGWGSWAGGGIDSNKRKRKRFIIKMPPKMPRKDDNKGSLIINEKAQAKIKPLLVSEVPFPFKSIKDYEASIRAPIGNTFVPEMAFRRYIEPSVITKMGTIIDPIDKGILMGVKKI